MEVAGWGGKLLWGFVYSEGDDWKDWGVKELRRWIYFWVEGPFCVVLVRLRSYVVMDGVLG